MSFTKEMDTLWYIKIMEYYSALKILVLSNHEKTRRKYNCILLTERSQSERLYTRQVQLCDILEKAKFWR